jgi:hypothetical protein
MLQVLFYIFLAYLLYNLVFRFIIPLYRTTRRIKKGFREMQEKMQGHPFAGQERHAQPQEPKPSGKTGEYIDFEEIK